MAGSLASHGAVVVCPEHRDGSSAVSFVRIPSAQDRYFARSKRHEVPYRRIPHEATEEVHELRDAQLRIRLWELGLLHEALLALDGAGDGDDDGSPKFTNLNVSTPPPALAQFANRLHVRDPGSIVFMGHSFGAATVVQFLKCVYYADDPEVAAIENPLFVPFPSAAIRAQITPRNVVILLDMWCFPLLAASQKALFERPLPVYAAGDDDDEAEAEAPGGAALLAVESEDFFKWKEHLHASARALSPDPRAPVVEASAFSSPSSSSSPSSDPDSHHDALPKPRRRATPFAKPHFFYVRKAAHLNQSDFGVLFPLLTRRVFGSEEPERALRLNLRAVLQVLRENGVPVARTSFADLVDGGHDSNAAVAAGFDKLAAVEEEDSDAEAGNHTDEQKGDVATAAAVGGIHDDKAIFDCSGSVTIDSWEWIDVVGMGRVVDAEDGETKEGVEVAEKQEPGMASVIEPSVTNDNGGEATAAVGGDVERVGTATAA